MENIKVGNTYQHYKGNIYKVLAIARSSEDINQILVIYQGLYNCPTFGKNPIWARPFEMFIEKVIIDGNEIQRFKKISL